jgi:hypothetical protein
MWVYLFTKSDVVISGVMFFSFISYFGSVFSLAD